MSAKAQGPPTKFGILLFEGFQALDVFGPVDVLNMLSKTTPLTQYIIAPTLEPVSTRINGASCDIGQSIVPTHSIREPPEDVEVLLVPGGRGTRDADATAPVVEFIRATYPKLRYIFTVCTGGALAARAGVLDGKRATTNKRSFEWVVSHGPNVTWVPKARWVVDGNAWTSSGISAGIDMMYAFVGQHFGEDVAEQIAYDSEYSRSTDPDEDPFALPLKK